jgi:hypothetical protein
MKPGPKPKSKAKNKVEVKPYSFPEVTVTAKRSNPTKNTVRSINDNPAVQVAKIFDPTGFTSWPDVGFAISDYKKNKGTLGNVALNLFGALPVIGKLKAPISLYKVGKGLTKSQQLASTVVKGVNKAGDVAAKVERAPLEAAKKITQGSSKPVAQAINKTSTAILKTSDKMGNITAGAINTALKPKVYSKQFMSSQDVTNAVTSGLNITNLSSDFKSATESMKNNTSQNQYKKGGWIQDVTKSIKRRGTEGVCTGKNFGGPSCPEGSKRYNLAKTFRKMAKNR